jgi:hypothetical protein
LRYRIDSPALLYIILGWGWYRQNHVISSYHVVYSY